jgi:hypothetical protein
MSDRWTPHQISMMHRILDSVINEMDTPLLIVTLRAEGTLFFTNLVSMSMKQTLMIIDKVAELKDNIIVEEGKIFKS